VTDGFDGICNHAVHLITEHPAIRTRNMNMNFIFSGWESKLTQWAYLYSRLPYVLFYARRLVEHIFGTFAQTDSVYLADIERRMEAGAVLWYETVAVPYREPRLTRFVEVTRQHLERDCREAGFRHPTLRDLERLRDSGARPREHVGRIARDLFYFVGTLRRRVRSLRRRWPGASDP